MDWVKFDAPAGKELVFFLANNGGGAAVRTRLSNMANTAQYLDFSSTNLGSSTWARWIAPADGTYVLQITAADGRVWGNDVQYALYIGDPHLLFAPLIGR
jgi:hypothetical protein